MKFASTSLSCFCATIFSVLRWSAASAALRWREIASPPESRRPWPVSLQIFGRKLSASITHAPNWPSHVEQPETLNTLHIVPLHQSFFTSLQKPSSVSSHEVDVNTLLSTKPGRPL